MAWRCDIIPFDVQSGRRDHVRFADQLIEDDLAKKRPSFPNRVRTALRRDGRRSGS
jgi:hypothetical protein